jgi:chromosome segregation ATPase
MVSNKLLLAGAILALLPGTASAQLRQIAPSSAIGIDIPSLRAEVTELEKRVAGDDALIKVQAGQLNLLSTRLDALQLHLSATDSEVKSQQSRLDVADVDRKAEESNADVQRAKLEALQGRFDNHTHSYKRTTFGFASGQITNLNETVDTQTSTPH